MRRQHNVLASTLLVLGIIYLCGPQETGFFDEGSTLARTGAHRAFSKFLGHEEDSESKVTASPHASSPLGPSATASAFPSMSNDIQSTFDPSNQEPLPPAGEAHASSSLAEEAPQGYASPDLHVGISMPTAKPEFEFQNDLNLDLPTSILQQYSNEAPLNYLSTLR